MEDTDMGAGSLDDLAEELGGATLAVAYRKGCWVVSVGDGPWRGVIVAVAADTLADAVARVRERLRELDAEDEP
jgi:hypothetical protein